MSAEDLIDKMIEPYADAWRVISQSRYEEDVPNKKRISQYLYWLNRIDFREWAPVALYYFKYHGDDSNKLELFLYLLERLTVYLAVSKASRMKRIERYLGILREMRGLHSETGEAIEDEAFCGDPILLDGLSFSNDEVEDFINYLDGDIYSRLPKMRLNIMLRLESLLRDKGVDVVWDEKQMTLEHVLPQTLSKKSKWFADFDVDEHAQWVHRLANLVLLNKTKNSKARNFDFTEKRVFLF